MSKKPAPFVDPIQAFLDTPIGRMLPAVARDELERSVKRRTYHRKVMRARRAKARGKR